MFMLINHILSLTEEFVSVFIQSIDAVDVDQVIGKRVTKTNRKLFAAHVYYWLKLAVFLMEHDTNSNLA